MGFGLCSGQARSLCSNRRAQYRWRPVPREKLTRGELQMSRLTWQSGGRRPDCSSLDVHRSEFWAGPQACDSFGGSAGGCGWQGHHLNAVMANTKTPPGQTLRESPGPAGGAGSVGTARPPVALPEVTGTGRGGAPGGATWPRLKRTYIKPRDPIYVFWFISFQKERVF